MARPLFLRTNEQEEAVRSLEWAETQAQLIATDPYHWKWVLIAMHNAAQGFMVLALWNGNGLLALRPKIAAKWLTAYENGGPFPVEKLDEFLNLYAKVKDSENFDTIGSGPFNALPMHDFSLEQLNSIRNEFIHFTPKGWSLELAGLPGICLHALELMQWLGQESTAILWYKPAHRVRAKRAIRRLTRTFQQLAKRSDASEETP